MDGDLLKMIFNVPDHIEMIRNGLYATPVEIQEMRVIVKTESRRIKRGVYQIEAERKKPHYKGYAVQRKRGVPAELDIRIVMDKIWEEYCITTDKLGHGGYLNPIPISKESAFAEGGYAPEHYEKVFRELNPKWNGISRWAFKFHVIEVQTR